MNILYHCKMKLKMDFRSKTTTTHSPVLHSHKVLNDLCPCGRYRQLNSVLYPNMHILKSSQKFVNGLVLN